MKDAPSEAALSLKAHARRLHVGLRRPHNWLQLIRYCVVGATGYLVNLGVYAIAYTDCPTGWRSRSPSSSPPPATSPGTGCGRSVSIMVSPITSTPAS